MKKYLLLAAAILNSCIYAYPSTYYFYLNPKGDVTLNTPFCTYVEDPRDDGDTTLSEMAKIMPKSIWGAKGSHQLSTNPRISLTSIPMKVLARTINGSDVSIEDDIAVIVNNKTAKNLKIKLPCFLPMRVFLSGNDMTLHGDTTWGYDISRLIVGVDPITMGGLLSSGCPFYLKHIVPGHLFITGKVSCRSCIVARSTVDILGDLAMGNPTDANQYLVHFAGLTLYNAHIVANGIALRTPENQTPLHLCGNSSLEFRNKSLFSGAISLFQEDGLFRTDPCDSDNTSIATLKNVDFKPSFIEHVLPTVHNEGGYFEILGEVDLSSTVVSLVFNRHKLSDYGPGKRILFVTSTHPIKGTPRVQFPHNPLRGPLMTDGLGRPVDPEVRFEKEGNKMYIVLSGPKP
jgi:hypothetical protein